MPMKYAGILLLAAVLAGCSTAPAPPKPRPWSPLAAIYYPYSDAIERGDLAAAEQYVSAGKKKHLDTLSPAEALAAINVVSPKSDLAPYKEMVHGSDATLILRGKIAENVSTGRVDFVREDGAWKIVNEMWNIGTDPSDSPWSKEPLVTTPAPASPSTPRR